MLNLQLRSRKDIDKLYAENESQKLALKEKESELRTQQIDYENARYESNDLNKQKLRLENELDKANKRTKQVLEEAEREARSFREQLRKADRQEGG